MSVDFGISEQVSAFFARAQDAGCSGAVQVSSRGEPPILMCSFERAAAVGDVAADTGLSLVSVSRFDADLLDGQTVAARVRANEVPGRMALLGTATVAWQWAQALEAGHLLPVLDRLPLDVAARAHEWRSLDDLMRLTQPEHVARPLARAAATWLHAGQFRSVPEADPVADLFAGFTADEVPLRDMYVNESSLLSPSMALLSRLPLLLRSRALMGLLPAGAPDHGAPEHGAAVDGRDVRVQRSGGPRVPEI